jgi:osmotically-inducible protein OsmY
MENFNGDREGYMRSIDDASEVRRRAQRHENIYDPANSSRFDRREDNHWSTQRHGHNSYEQQFDRHYVPDTSNRFPESGTNYDMKGQHSGKGPRNYQRSDERLKEIICERLTDDPRVDARELEVEVNNCNVTITGYVADKEMKRRIEDVVEGIQGISNTENRVHVNSNQSES